jgi:nucleoside-diphosphate-sugar epimerase
MDLLALGELARRERFDVVVDMICFTAEEADVAVGAFGGLVRHYVMCSTVDVYTKPANYYPVDEAHERRPSRAFDYAYQKQRAEEILEAAHLASAFPVTVLRPAATYASHVVAPLGTMDLYVERLRAGRPVILPGDGSSLWVACHRDDVARAFVAALGNQRTFGRAYNVASDELVTWDRYWRTFAGALGIDEPEFLHVPTNLLTLAAPSMAEWCGFNFQYHNVIDSGAAKQDLDFVSSVPWAKGAQLVAHAWKPRPVEPELSESYERLVKTWERVVVEMARRLPGT